MGYEDLFHLASVRPLVRYVDEDQAVIETHFTAEPSVSAAPGESLSRKVDVCIEINGSDGFHDEGLTPLHLQDGHGAVQFDMVKPNRWWPAGMGEQQLYELRISLLINGELADEHSTTLGLTSVRVPQPDLAESGDPDDAKVHLLVNGHVCDIKSIVSIDAADEQKMLPVAGNSLMLVRGHYGPDMLYDAADRAGILVIQCVPIHPVASPETDVKMHVDRLSHHPSLAGWCVGHLGDAAEELRERIRALDPTHSVFMEAPGTPGSTAA